MTPDQLGTVAQIYRVDRPLPAIGALPGDRLIVDVGGPSVVTLCRAIDPARLLDLSGHVVAGDAVPTDHRFNRVEVRELLKAPPPSTPPTPPARRGVYLAQRPRKEPAPSRPLQLVTE